MSYSFKRKNRSCYNYLFVRIYTICLYLSFILSSFFYWNYLLVPQKGPFKNPPPPPDSSPSPRLLVFHSFLFQPPFYFRLKSTQPNILGWAARIDTMRGLRPYKLKEFNHVCIPVNNPLVPEHTYGLLTLFQLVFQQNWSPVIRKLQ